MGFFELEAMGKRALEQFPVAKRVAKRIYQFTCVALSRERFRAEGDLTRISPSDDYEYLCGYYDKSPWDATDRFVLCLRANNTYKNPAPKEPASVCIIDTQNDNKVTVIATTHAWNVQQGCMAQWLGPDFKDRIIYNDFRDGHYCSVVLSVKNMVEEKVLPRPVYDVSRDGTFALSLDFNRLHRMRPGYGYSNQRDKTKGILCPDSTCIWKMDIGTGKVEKLFKYTDFAAFEPDETMKCAEHKVNHLMISPNGKRFMVLHRWFDKGRKHTRLVTVNVDKTEMYNLSDDVFVSHCYWKNDEEILAFLRKNETGNHYYLMKDKTQDYMMYWPELNTDGHCSYSPDAQLVITDTYPNRNRIASIYLCTEEDSESRRIARVYSPFKYDNDSRCDLHPRWNHAEDAICIDSAHEGNRGLYIVLVPRPIDGNTVIPQIIHSVWVGYGEKNNTIKNCEKSWKTFCSGFRFIEWTENNFDIKNCDSQYAKEAYSKHMWAFVSDYIRLKVLYDYGGIYIDSDMELYRGLNGLLSYRGFIGAESKHTISCGVIGTVPRAKWIRDLLDEYETVHFINPDGCTDTRPITKRIQKYFVEKYDYEWNNHNQEIMHGVIVLTNDYFAPLNCFTGKLEKTANTIGFHHGDNSWKSKSERYKKKIMQIGTRIIGEDNRAKLVALMNNK